MPSPSLSTGTLRIAPTLTTTTNPDTFSTPPSRRFTARLRDMLTFRSLRPRPSPAAPSTTADVPLGPVPSPEQISPSPPRISPASRRRRHNRTRRRTRQSTTAVRHASDASASRLSSRAFRFPPADADGFEPPSPQAQSYPLRRGEFAVRRADSLPSTAVVGSAFADINPIPIERGWFAVMDRAPEEFNVEGRVGPEVAPVGSLYVGRLPTHSRHRVAVTMQNAYYIPGQRRPGRHSHLTTELERDLRWGVRTLRLNAEPTPAASYDYAASDDQIEALPTFVMEKGETRSVQQIFAAMGAPEHEKIVGMDRDECGGLMTSYIECAICLSDFEAGDEVTLLPCGHFFHLTGCVREWLRNHARTCPTCRADICISNTGSSDELGSHSATVATSEEIS